MNHEGACTPPPTIAALRTFRRIVMLLLFASLTVLFPFPLKAESQSLLMPNTMEARVAACTQCHGADGRAAPDGFYPRIAGKPAGYLLAQLIHFRDGKRSYEPMHHLLQGLSDQYLAEIAQYFSDLDHPYASPAAVNTPAPVLQQGRTLAERGDQSKGLPACASCHGSSFSGLEPNIPGLLGLPRDYITAQLGSWRMGLRKAAEPDCMADIARQLTPAQIGAVSAWLASRTVEEPYIPAPAGSLSLPVECGVMPSTTGGQP